MKHDDFQKLMRLQLDRRRFTYLQKAMHYYEKHKSIRTGISLVLGGILLTCGLNLYPGVHLQVQRPIKLKYASSYLQYTYLKGIIFESEPSWEKAITVNDYYVNKMKRDNIYDSGFIAQSVDLLNQIVLRYEAHSSLLIYTLESLGDLIEPVVNYDMKLFRHEELNSALSNFWSNVIRCTEDVGKRLDKFGVEERDKAGWSVCVSTFLILVEVNKDKEEIAKKIQEMNSLVNHLNFTAEMCAQPHVLARIEKFANSEYEKVRNESRKLIDRLERIKESQEIIINSGIKNRLK